MVERGSESVPYGCWRENQRYGRERVRECAIMVLEIEIEREPELW
jgi:hypothetical protein